jgi:hypothetical protein
MSRYALRSDLVEDKAAALEDFARQLEGELNDALGHMQWLKKQLKHLGWVDLSDGTTSA